MEDIHFPKPKLHFFICINDRTATPENNKPSCGPQITAEMVKEVKHWLVQQRLAAQIYCTKVKCLGFCNSDGGVACVYPKGRFIKGLHTVEDIKTFIEQEISQLQKNQ